MKNARELIDAIHELTQAVRSLGSTLQSSQRMSHTKDVFGNRTEELIKRSRASEMTAEQASSNLKAHGIEASAKTVKRRCAERGWNHTKINEHILPELQKAILEKRRRAGAEKNLRLEA